MRATHASFFVISFVTIPLLQQRRSNDRKVVLIAVDRVGEALGEASEELRGDREVVMAAVQRDGAALRFASVALRGDKEVKKTAARVCLTLI